MTDPLFVFDANDEAMPVNSDELHAGWKITLPPAIRRHALGAMRLHEGDDLQLSDGRGLRILATLTDGESGTAEVLEVGREPRPITRITLIQALAKQGHDEMAVDMATQIGVDVVLPWQANRSIAKWKSGRTNRRWAAVLKEATQQSRRSWMPQLGACLGSRQIVSLCRKAVEHGDLIIVLHQDANTSWSLVNAEISLLADRCLDDGQPRTIGVIVGPEGGIADEEIEEFKTAGARCCVLGRNILRASTAGPVAISLVSQALGRFS